MEKWSTLTLPSAFDPEQIDRWVRFGNEGGAIFLDYDGTLTPIVDRPEMATLTDSMRVVLQRLGERLPVSIVSGRDITSIVDLVGLDGLAYVGSHGLDIIGPSDSGLREELALDFIPELDRAEHDLRRKLDDIPGVFVERKRFSISVHVRRVVVRKHNHVNVIVNDIQQAHPSLRREGGKMLFELRPNIDWDKGRAVNWLLDATRYDLSTALFIGDDLTDETVFKLLAGRGTGIVVAETERPTDAELRLSNPSEVYELLERLSCIAGQTKPANGWQFKQRSASLEHLTKASDSSAWSV
jgi:trehalose-phosphatase